MEEEALREFALQPHRDGDGGIEIGVRQDDHELLAAVARDDVRRTHRMADDLRQVHERRIAGRMAVRVVQLLEIVEVEHRDAHRLAGATGAGDLALHGVVHPASIERAGQVILADLLADTFELALELTHALLGLFRLSACAHQFVARTHHVDLHPAGVGHQFVDERLEAVHRFGRRDALRVLADLAVELDGVTRHVGEPLHEDGQQRLQRLLRVGQPRLQMRLLEDHFLEATFGLPHGPQVDGLADEFAQQRHLTVDPLLVLDELVDVVDEQADEAHQIGEQFLVGFGTQFDLAPELPQLLAESGPVVRGLGLAHAPGDLEQLRIHVGIALDARRKCRLERCGEKFARFLEGRIAGDRGGSGPIPQSDADRAVRGTSGNRIGESCRQCVGISRGRGAGVLPCAQQRSQPRHDLRIASAGREHAVQAFALATRRPAAMRKIELAQCFSKRGRRFARRRTAVGTCREPLECRRQRLRAVLVECPLQAAQDRLVRIPGRLLLHHGRELFTWTRIGDVATGDLLVSTHVVARRGCHAAGREELQRFSCDDGWIFGFGHGYRF